MFKNRYWLSVGLVTLFAFGLGLPAAFAQIFDLPQKGSGWSTSAIGIDPNKNDIMVVGTGNTLMGNFYASSITPSGALNTAFGGGVVTTVVSKNLENWVYAGAVQADGKLLSAGFYTYNQGMGFAVVRYDTNGTLDKTFNKTGIVKTNFSTNNEEICAMVVQPNGSIVVAGQSSNSTNTVVLARYTTSGALDTTFGSGGTFIDPIPTINGHSVSWLEVTAIALQSDGYIIVGAEAALANQPIQMLLIAYTPSGKIDSTFGNGGIVSFNVPNCDSRLWDIAVDSDDNSIIMAGSSDDGTDQELTLVCFTAAGGLDTSFGGGNGYIREAFGATPDQYFTSAYSVALDDYGKIVVSGQAPNGNLLVARFEEDGTLDPSFNNGLGYADDFAVSPLYGSGKAVLIQPWGTGDYKIVAAGSETIVRYNSNGTPDTSFYAPCPRNH